MNSATLSTRKITGLDYRIWMTMAGCWLVCAGFFGYKKIKMASANPEACGALRILVNGTPNDGIYVCDPDVAALFQIEAPPGAKVEWHFSDGYKVVNDVRALHKFKTEDDYKVVATVNGECEYVKKITVKKTITAEVVRAEVKIFTDSAKATVGNRIRFAAVANVPVNSYQWTVLPTNETQTGGDATFSFPYAGEFTVRVVINNNPAVSQEQQITVTNVPQVNLPPPGPLTEIHPPPLPGPWDKQVNPSPGPKQVQGTDTAVVKPVPPPDNIHEIDPETFKGLLQGVLREGKKVNELYPYLKYEGSTQVEVNGKKPFMALDDFCNEKRNKKIKTLAFVRQKDNPKYIQTIKVELKGIWPFN